MSLDEKSTVEEAWNSLLQKNPREGFTRLQLQKRLKSQYGLDVKTGKLQTYLEGGYCVKKLDVLPDKKPNHYIKGDAMPKNPLNGGKDGTDWKKDLPPVTEDPIPEAAQPEQSAEVAPAEGAASAAAEKPLATEEATLATSSEKPAATEPTVEPVPAEPQQPTPRRPQKTLTDRAIDRLIIFRSMIRGHGFETHARAEGCELNFEYGDLDKESKADPDKFRSRGEKFEAAMEKFKLMDTFEACGELRSLFTGRNMFAIRKAFGPKKANDIFEVVKDKTRMEELRSLDLTTAVGLVKKAKDAIRQHQAAQAAAAPPRRRPIADIIGDVLDKPAAATSAKGTEEKKDPKPTATGGKAERKPSVSPAPTEKPTTEGPVADSSATVPPPVVEPPIPVNPPTPAPTPVVETEAAKPPHDDVVALQEKVNSLTDQVRLVSQERAEGQLKLSAALTQVASLEDELKASNKTRQRFEGDLEIANGKYAGLTKVLDDEKIAHHNTMGEKTALEQQVRELTAKVDALPKVQQPAATRWARIGVLGRRVQQSPISRTIAFVLIAALILEVFLQPSFENWKVYSQPAKVADAPAAISDTRSEETLKLQQELDREFEAFKTATQQKGEAQ